MVTIAAALACVAAYPGATGAIARFNTIPIRAVSTATLLVALGVAIASAIGEITTRL